MKEMLKEERRKGKKRKEMLKEEARKKGKKRDFSTS